MFYIYDTKNKKVLGTGNTLRINAERKALRKNVTWCGIDELDKPPEERRFIIKEI